jgi:hypothetical protein
VGIHRNLCSICDRSLSLSSISVKYFSSRSLDPHDHHSGLTWSENPHILKSSRFSLMASTSLQSSVSQTYVASSKTILSSHVSKRTTLNSLSYLSDTMESPVMPCFWGSSALCFPGFECSVYLAPLTVKVLVLGIIHVTLDKLLFFLPESLPSAP